MILGTQSEKSYELEGVPLSNDVSIDWSNLILASNKQGYSI